MGWLLFAAAKPASGWYDGLVKMMERPGSIHSRVGRWRFLAIVVTDSRLPWFTLSCAYLPAG